MKIVITGRDFSTNNQHALETLLQAGHEVTDYSKNGYGVGTDPEIIYNAVKDADAVIAGLEPYNDFILSRCPNLRLISRRGIGYDTVDLAACKKYNITLCRTTGTVEGAVAEHVLAYILYFARHIEQQNAFMQNHRWERIMMPGAKTRTIGLIGFGGIGKEIAVRANAFGMNVLYYCRHPKKEWEEQYHVTYAPLNELLHQSDYVSVNVPLTDTSKNMCNASFFEQMKKDGIFINISRGPIVDVDALKNALLKNQIKGCAIDVFNYEPCCDSPLIGCENAILTPHTAPYTQENFIAMNELSAKNVLDFYKNQLDSKYIVAL